jgi:hypothetical protein
MVTMSSEDLRTLLDATLKAQEEWFQKKELAQEDRFLKKMEEMQKKVEAAQASADPTQTTSSAKSSKICRDSIPVISKSSSVMEVDRWMRVVIGEAESAMIDMDTDRACIAKILALVPLSVKEMVKGTINLEEKDLYKKFPSGNYTDLLQKILDHFKARSCDLDMGQELACRTQQASETIEQYKDELIRMASHTGLNKLSEEHLHLVVQIFLIKGMRRQDWRKELAKEENGRTFDQIVKLLIRLECSEASGKGKAASANATSTYKHQKNSNDGERKRKPRSEIECHRCSKKGHIAMYWDGARQSVNKKAATNHTWTDVKDKDKDGKSDIEGMSVSSSSVSIR